MARPYLKVGDRVAHINYAQWGVGTVVEARTSRLPGGTCMVRIMFEDEEERSFINDLDSEMCCRIFGIVFDDEVQREPRRVSAKPKAARRLTRKKL